MVSSTAAESADIVDRVHAIVVILGPLKKSCVSVPPNSSNPHALGNVLAGDLAPMRVDFIHASDEFVNIGTV